MAEPLITVLMPAYNASAYIAEAIRSVLAQSFTRFELLVINDGSADDTAAVVRSFDDPRIVLVCQENSGISVALNRGLQLARANYIVRFDADDCNYPHRLATQYAYMEAHPEVVIMGSAVDYMDKDGQFIFRFHPPACSDEAIRRLSYLQCPFIHSSVIYRKQVIQRCGGYNAHAHGFEDHFLWQKVAAEGHMANLPEALLKVRFNPSSFTLDERRRQKEYREIKYRSIRQQQISAAEGERLLQLIREQASAPLRRKAYHTMLAKKFLWNNYQPEKARMHLQLAARDKKRDLTVLGLTFLSCLPASWIRRIYRLSRLLHS
jgi:glycosyltransferase involved in cell wall biosynthesis